MLALIFSTTLAFAAEETKQAETKVGPPQGRLLVVGGGTMGPLWDVFLELAGGTDAPIVVIPTANDAVAEVDPAVKTLGTRGATQVTQLHTRDSKVADSEEFVALSDFESNPFPSSSITSVNPSACVATRIHTSWAAACLTTLCSASLTTRKRLWRTSAVNPRSGTFSGTSRRQRIPALFRKSPA